MRKSIVLFLAVLGLSPTLTHAAVWVNFSRPTSFQYSGGSSNSYQFDKSAAVSATGWTFLAKLPSLPPLGMSQFQLSAPPLDPTLATPNQFKVNSYDIGWDISPKSFKLLLGYGIGKLDFQCVQTDCSAYSFKPLELHQYFTQIGVPLGVSSDFHFDLRRVIGRIQINRPGRSEIMHLQGMLVAFGFRLGF